MRQVAYGIGALVALSILGTQWLWPGVPWRALARPTAQAETWRAISESTHALRGTRGGYVFSFVPAENYFSGSAETTLYLGKKDALAGTLVVASAQEKRVRASFFLNFMPVEVSLRTGGHGDFARAQEMNLLAGAGEVSTWEIRVENVPEGLSELSIVLAPVGEADDTHGDAPRPLLNRDVLSYRLKKGKASGPAVRLTEPALRRGEDCKRAEKVLLMRGEEIAVINCTKKPLEGVLFGPGREPLYYRSPPRSLSLFATGSRAEVIHVPSPFSAGSRSTEDNLGS